MMEIRLKDKFDVVVIGSGFAGLQAALYSAKSGKRVAIMSAGKFCGGSSFYPGTWGLGLVSAQDEESVEEFKNSILEVGCGMNDEQLVQELLVQELIAIEELKDMKIPLKEAKNANQKEFIPCFDHEVRKWYGLEPWSISNRYKELLKEYSVQIFDYTTLVDIHCTNNEIQSVLVEYRNELYAYACDSLVIASGGIGALYQETLNTNDITAIPHYLIQMNGCELVNMEFQQMMFGYLKPGYKTIYNEKVFQYTEFSVDGKSLFKKNDPLLIMRSGYGPFTSRLESKEVDIKIVNEIQEGNQVKVSYKDELKDIDSEFVDTYFDWLKKEKQLGIETDFMIDMFYHAANGGIKMNKDTSTSISGVYVCGEASGGIHGADRIGGLATASALTFGRIAGIQASSYTPLQNQDYSPFIIREVLFHGDETIRAVKEIMSKSAMVIRNEVGLIDAIRKVEELSEKTYSRKEFDVKEYKKEIQVRALLTISKSILQAAVLRRESRGSHYRSDAKEQCEEKNRRIVSICRDGAVFTTWEEVI